ncbi:MAG: GIY-YIG nuclease family protein [Candidatus Roizmanbacteria bacterium]
MQYQSDGSIPNTKAGISTAPATTGVYIFRKKDEIVYIGKAVSLKSRLLSHYQSATLDKKEAAIFDESDTIDYVITDSEFKALVLEAHLISSIKPKYNVRWRDDKSYLYIVITAPDEYPKVSLARKQDIQHIGDRHFGPFASTRSAESVLRYLRKIVPYCTQKHISKTPCFYSKIGQCDPCPNTIEKMTDQVLRKREKARYRRQIKNLIKILEGNIEAVKKDFRKQIAEYTESQNFEAAIKSRDAMHRLTFMIEHGSFRLDEYESYNNSQKSTESLQALLHDFWPNIHIGRVECYDNSTLGFSNSTASMVVFIDGLVDKKEYKRFKLGKLESEKSTNPKASHPSTTAQRIELISDFDMMKEVMIRRQRNTKWPKPDLIVIDGGVPQLRAVIDAQNCAIEQLQAKKATSNKQTSTSLHNVIPGLSRDLQNSTENSGVNQHYTLRNIPVIGIAKKPDRLIVPIQNDATIERETTFAVIRPSSNDFGFRLIQAIRDEAHRFAKKYHTYLRKQSSLG